MPYMLDSLAYSLILDWMPMPRSRRSPELLHKLFVARQVVEFHDLQHALHDASPATTFRYLSQIPYHRSYNFNGRYYTARDPQRYDRFGLFAIDDIYFSRDRTLGQTLHRLVEESSAGWTQRELYERLRVRVQPLLLEAVRRSRMVRENLDGVYVYLHALGRVREAQLQRRAEQITSRAAQLSDGTFELSERTVIQILLTLIRHPGSDVAQLVRRLRGHSPPITALDVHAVFGQYDLDQLGEKGGATNC